MNPGIESIWEIPLHQFRDKIASETPTPGGGSVAAVSSAMGLGLIIMALEISHRRADAKDIETATRMIAESRELLEVLSVAADEDIQLFEAYMRALKMPKKSDDERDARRCALKTAVLAATQSPLDAGEKMVEALDLAVRSLAYAHKNVISDVGAGAAILWGSLIAVLLNVDINLPSIADIELRTTLNSKRAELKGRAELLYVQVQEGVQAALT